ncbi:DUF5916 domain-containing protein [Bacteroidota bacterium]
MRKVILLIIIITLGVNLSAQTPNKERRTIETVKISEAPKIDGVLDDKAWENAPIAKDFFQYEPYNGNEPSQPTEVKIVYDDVAIYVGATLFDSNPDSILRELSVRDAFDGANADLFAVGINTFNDGINAVTLMVSASGVQSDAKNTGNEDDENWDAVWESAVKITDDGWNVEIKIPYSALRFPKKDVQTWGIHLWRNIRRYREWSTWNFADINIQGIMNQMGELTGIKGVEPPLRLSVTPYVSAYLQNDADDNSWGNDFNAGMDLKWGINQSFTLDMILIPDFGQVQSDDEVLNLSPYEIMYAEKRAFFTEGTELFNKGGIFYSRRIGSQPKNFGDVEDQLNVNDTITENPIETRLINATKISGRTDNGLGIGFFNAMTGASEAYILDTIINAKRKYQTQGFTNYNMIVLDQSLKNNSYVSFVNTNVMHVEENYSANVTGGEFVLKNKENSYQLFGRGSVSQIYTDSTELGHAYNLHFSKTKGNFLFEVMHNTESDTYDPNDMGYLQQNNESTWYVEFDYFINEPFWKVLNWRSEINFVYQNLYKPRKFANFQINMVTHTTFAKKYLHVGTFFQFNPVRNQDHFEPRVEGWKFTRPRSGINETWISTDYRKMIAVDVRAGAWKAFDYDRYGYWIVVGPRVRFSDKWLFIYNVTFDMNYNTYGYIEDYEDSNGETKINFGKRDVSTIINTLNTSYIFNSKMSLNFRARHYWSRVEYSDFYELQKDGYLSPSIGFNTYGTDQNYNYNAFTIDMKYQWRFAPGSELALVWKNAIYTDDSKIINNFWDNLNNTFESSQINSISLKILYYLDYQYLVKNK